MGKKKGGSSLGIMILIILFLLTGVTIYVFGSTHPPTNLPPPPIINTPAPSAPNVINTPAPIGQTVQRETFQQNNQTLLRFDSPLLKPDGMYQIHFIHIPKCGGTSMTAVLRELMCSIDPVHNSDCCTNPGFCDYQSGRKCSVIKGCINHFPNRPFIYKSMPTVTILREPTSRLVSAWFYRGHNPNNDFFQVRPEFKEIKQGKRRKAEFVEYLEMVEYNNIQTRMLGANSFPYRDIAITDEIFDQAVDALDHIYFIGLQEAYELSIELMLRELGFTSTIPVKREREQASKSQQIKKELIVSNASLMNRAREVNQYDLKLYELGKARFCAAISKYEDLKLKLSDTRVSCP